MYRRPLLLLLLLASVVILIVRPKPELPIQSLDPERFKDQFYLNTFTARGFNGDGQLNQIIKGQRLNQPVDSGDHYITEPDVTLFEDKQEKWTLTASSGWVDNRQEMARLNENITLRSAGESGLKLDTSKLDINLSSRQMNTADSVEIRQSSGVTRGIGLDANLSTSRFEIKSKVESTYEP